MESFTNSITKRLGVLTALLGMTLLGFGIYDMGCGYWRPNCYFDTWLDVVSLNRKRHPAVLIGSYLVLVGMLMSILYDRLTGKVVNWVLYGTIKRDD